VDHCLGSFLRSVDVLLESRPHTGDALVDAAPSLNNTSLLLLLIDFEINWLLADGEYLFKLHAFRHILGVHDGFDIVLDLGLGTLTGVGLLKVD
jgi:hypothetical protein